MNSKGFEGRLFLVSGSASRKSPDAIIRYGHALIEEVVGTIVSSGGRIVLQLGKEPRQIDGDPSSPALVFDWTALAAAANALRCEKPRAGAIVAVLSERSEDGIPPDRREAFRRLLADGVVRVDYIQPGSRSATMMREVAARLADVAILLGGGTGVEHLAELFQSERKTVIPFDLPLGASREDGTGGSEQLNREAKTRPALFLRLSPGAAGLGANLLSRLSTANGTAPVEEVRDALCAVAEGLESPGAFCVRLQNPTVSEFVAVEAFFRQVVDPTLDSLGFRIIEIGKGPARSGFINLEIFQELHFCRLAVADVSGQRANCLIELGYALGRNRRVIVTAMEGTQLPFDQAAIPCFFWRPGGPVGELRRDLLLFLENQIGRPPLVT